MTQNAGPLPPPPSAEEEVLAAVRSGDLRTALTLLMRLHGDAVFAYCRRSLREESLAQDVHQQTFVQAYHDLGRFTGRSSLQTWLFQIAHHRCLDAVRSRRRFLGRFVPTEHPPETEDPALPAEERLVQGVVERGLATCLQQLAPAVRTAVTLRFSEGFSYEQMSEICQEKAGTLQARVARALPVLRRCMESRGGLP